MKANIRRLAHAIDRKQLPGHPSPNGIPVIMRQAVVQSFNLATGYVTVLFGGSLTPVDLPYEGWPPGVGEVCWIRQIGALQIIIGSTTRLNWLGPWNSQWGILSPPFSNSTSDQTGITTDTDVPGAVMAWTAIVNRRVRHSISLMAGISVAGNTVIVKVTDAANTELGRGTIHPNGTNGDTLTFTFEENTMIAGPISRKLRVTVGGSIGAIRGLTQPTQYTVTDIGPINAP